MKTTIRTLMMTAAIICVGATAASAETPQVTSTTVIEKSTGVTSDAEVMGRMTQDLKAALQQRGYDVGTVNTTFDAKTAGAVRAFQRDSGLPETGEASADLLRSLGVNTTIASSVIEERDVIRYRLANKGSENANVYDDPGADRTTHGKFRQRYERVSERIDTPATTTTVQEVIVTTPLNR